MTQTPIPTFARCPRMTGSRMDGNYRRCPYKLVPGEALCAGHLAHERRAAEKHAQWQAEFAARTAKQAATQMLASEIARQMNVPGIENGVVSDYSGDYVRLTPEAAQALIVRLQHLSYLEAK